MIEKYFNKNITKGRGFTLVETLLYMSILSLIIASTSSLMYLVFQSRIKNNVIAEVEQQGNQALRIILDELESAQAINIPAPGLGSPVLDLSDHVLAQSPIIVNMVNDKISMKEGTANAVHLTTSKVVVSDLIFYNYSQPGTPGSVRVEFTVSHINPENMGVYDYSKKFTGTGSLRWP